ncbi:hypothetical protein SAMN05444144_10770 [Flavobacterium akiainvivens]|nr:hypothetical protein SAMN05444144_10770 [Flavobacterium akiainvivens]
MLVIAGCKTQKPIIDTNETCYNVVKGIAYVNVYNNTPEAFTIPRMLFDADGTLLKPYYRMSGDTLYIRPAQIDDVLVSDGSGPTSISGESITLNTGENYLQGFKPNMDFKVITLTGYGNDISINPCLP